MRSGLLASASLFTFVAVLAALSSATATPGPDNYGEHLHVEPVNGVCAIYVYGGDATTFHAQAVTRDPYHKCDNPIAAQVKFQGGWVPGTDYSGWVYHHAIAVARSPTGATMACRGYHHAHHKGNENHDIYDVHNVHQHHSGQC